MHSGTIHCVPVIHHDVDDDETDRIARRLVAHEPQHAQPDMRSLIIPRHMGMVGASRSFVQRIL